MLYHRWNTVFQKYGPVNRQGMLGDIPPLEAQQFATAQASKQQKHNSGSNPKVITGHSVVKNPFNFLNCIGLSGLFGDSGGL